MYWHVANTYAFFREPVHHARQRRLQAAHHRADGQAAAGRRQPVHHQLLVDARLRRAAGAVRQRVLLAGRRQPDLRACSSAGRTRSCSARAASTDFAYDADVISHEFTHAVIDTLGKLNPSGFEDVQGLNDDPGAMNEGLADYFSSALGGDPLVGEYGGRNIPGNGAAEGAVRDLTNKDLCADDRWGEVHQDSQAFSASLWAARVAIAGDPKAAGFDAAKGKSFDAAVLAAIQSFPDQVDMPTAATAIAHEVELRFDATARSQRRERVRARTSCCRRASASSPGPAPTRRTCSSSTAPARRTRRWARPRCPATCSGRSTCRPTPTRSPRR